MSRYAVSGSFIEQLQASVATASTDPAELQRCARDWSWGSLYAQQGDDAPAPDVVVRARDDEEVVATLRAAAEYGVPVVPRGGGSGVMGAAVPHHGGVVVDLSDMRRVIEIDEESLTATVEAGLNGREFERLLNERGLSFPHYPASAEWASVGGYVAARGSGVLSSRYGKIEDQILALRVVTPTGEIVDTVPVPRHAVGPELTQLFVGSEGTFGVITRVTVRLIPLPPHRRFESVALPSLEAGVDALRQVMQRGLRPAVIRFYDADASSGSLAAVVGQRLDGPTALLMFEGEHDVAEAEAEVSLRLLAERGGTRLQPELCETWWERRYDFYHPPHYPTLPSMWGTIDAVAPYGTILDVYHAIRGALAPFEEHGLRLRTHFSHWYEWGTMVYPRFVIEDVSGHPDPVALYKDIWRAGVEAVLEAGGVINDHHGVGATLAPYLERQWGAAGYATLMRVKRALDPANVMNPGKLGFPVDQQEAA